MEYRDKFLGELADEMKNGKQVWEVSELIESLDKHDKMERDQKTNAIKEVFDDDDNEKVNEKNE